MLKNSRRTLCAAAVIGSLWLTACSASAEPAAQTAGTTTPMARPGSESAPAAPSIAVSPANERLPATGGSDMFSGVVSILPLFNPNEASTGGAGQVTFEPGARTAWHSHPAGQRLIVTAGTGWIQQEGQDRITVREGDVVWFAPGVRHWHGATADGPMTHIAVQDTIDGSNAEWMEHVSDAQYLGQE